MESESSSHKWRSSDEVFDEGDEEGVDGGVTGGPAVIGGEAAGDVAGWPPVLPGGDAEAREEEPGEAEEFALPLLAEAVNVVVEGVVDTPPLLAEDFEEDDSTLVVPELLGAALDETVEDLTTEVLEDVGEAGVVDELGAALELVGTVVDGVPADRDPELAVEVTTDDGAE